MTGKRPATPIWAWPTAETIMKPRIAIIRSGPTGIYLRFKGARRRLNSPGNARFPPLARLDPTNSPSSIVCGQ
jgi:hypothetical protein